MNKKAKMKTIVMMVLCLMLLVGISYAMTVTLNAPSSGSWWTTSNSVDHNWTVVINDSESIDWCVLYSNRTGTNALVANFSTGFTNATPFISGIGWSDTNSTSKYWNVSCYNSTNLIDSGTFLLGVDATIPSIILDSPDDSSYQSSTTVTLKYTPTDSSNLDACVLYHNISGTWNNNKTNITVTNNIQDITVYATQSEGHYKWNVICNDSASNSAWAEDTNRTLTIDSTVPVDIKFITSNNTVSTDATPLIKWNQTTEINFEKYVVSVSRNLSSFDTHIFQTQIITTITSNATTLTGLGVDDIYYIKITAQDLAGNQKNTTLLVYNLDTTVLTVTLNYPSNNTYTSDTTPDFNVTVVDNNPDTCLLWLSNSTGGSIVINVTDTSITSAAVTTLNPSAMVDGAYKFNIECNDSLNNRVNVSSSNLVLTVDTTAPTAIIINSTWHQQNNTDLTPVLSWTLTTEINFARYFIEARYISNNSLEYSVNVTNRTTTNAELTLSVGSTYNFSVTAYDLAGNSVKTVNTTDTWNYVDGICGTLNAGWNLCGATWTTSKNLSDIGSEASATFVTVWNNSHEWSTCIVGVTAANCDIDTGINPSDIGHVWVYVSTETVWSDRTWVATQLNANITLHNNTNGWNIIPGEFRNGRTFWQLGNDDFTSVNVSMFSLPYNNGSTVSFVNKGLFKGMSINSTVLEYGKAMWVFYNGTGTTVFDVGSW